MFGIGGWEFVVIVVLAVLLFGPDKLPDFARTIGRFMRDFKRYQSMMESTIRAEVMAADPMRGKDPFETGKEFREKVAGGGFTKPKPADAADLEAPETPEAPEQEAPGPEAPEPEAHEAEAPNAPEAEAPEADASDAAPGSREGERGEA